MFQVTQRGEIRSADSEKVIPMEVKVMKKGQTREKISETLQPKTAQSESSKVDKVFKDIIVQNTANVSCEIEMKQPRNSRQHQPRQPRQLILREIQGHQFGKTGKCGSLNAL